MRILQILAGDLWGGAEAQVYQLARYLAESGVPLDVIVFNDLELAQRLRSASISTHVVSETTHAPARVMTRVMSLARDLRPNVIHSHDAKSNVVGVAAASVVPGCVSMRTAHGAMEFQLAGHQLKKRLYGWLDRQATRAHGATVAVSAPLGEALAREGIPRVEIIENGLDTGALSPDGPLMAFPGRPGVFRVGIACRLVPLKRVDVLIRAIAEIPSGRAIEAVVLGSGPEEANLRALVNEVGCGDRVHLMGFQADVHGGLRALDALAIPSDHEGLPMVLLEAMAVGTPVLAHAVGGIPAALGDTGILLDSQDPGEWAAHIMELAGDPDRRSSLAAAARARVVEHFSIGVTGARYEALYRRLAADGIR